MMRKDYVRLADALRSAKPSLDVPTIAKREAWLAAVHVVADVLARDNPRFNRERFLSACGVSHG